MVVYFDTPQTLRRYTQSSYYSQVGPKKHLLEETWVPANDPHYDAKLWTHLHPYGTGSMLAEPGAGSGYRHAENRLALIQSWFVELTTYVATLVGSPVTRALGVLSPAGAASLGFEPLALGPQDAAYCNDTINKLAGIHEAIYFRSALKQLDIKSRDLPRRSSALERRSTTHPKHRSSKAISVG